jgi:hypothetical protein
MNRFRLVAAGTILILATVMAAQQPPPGADSPAQSPHSSGGVNGMPSVDDHLKMLSDKLALTPDQQSKARPILQEMQESTQKVAENKKLSDQERTSRLKACHSRADTKLRQILSDDQKKTLDQLEQDAHMGLHGHANSAQPAK